MRLRARRDRTFGEPGSGGTDSPEASDKPRSVLIHHGDLVPQVQTVGFPAQSASLRKRLRHLADQGRAVL